jgi:thiamine pyrophosphate-dependent acetolactate synthase large subunit-like protein
MTTSPSTAGHNALERAAFVKQLLAGSGNTAVVCGLGTPGSNAADADDRLLNFYLVGAMGSAAPIGLGIALSQPDRPVLVLTGDGELMMNIGVLATIAVQRPKNLSIVVLDNEMFGETGLQASHTADGVDIAGIALACGFPEAVTIRSEEAVPGLIQRSRAMNGPFLGVVKVRGGRYPSVLPIRNGVEMRLRFSRAVASKA